MIEEEGKREAFLEMPSDDLAGNAKRCVPIPLRRRAGIMSAEVMMEFLSECSLESRLGFFVASHCAPVLKGIKVSNIMTSERGTWRKLVKILEGSGVLCSLLSVKKGREVLLLYRYESLREHLEREKVRRFLEESGYEEFTVTAVIIKLRQRYAGYVRDGGEFPHELGVILEYPVEDVRGFIKNKGKNCLTEKYWKVYHDREQAEEVFARYDRAREAAMEEIIAGYPLREIAAAAV